MPDIKMKKNIIAVILVFSVLFTFASCQKLEESDEFKVETEVYAVDDEGETKNVYTRVNDEGITEMYMMAENGDVVTVKEDATVVAKKVVSATTTSAKKKKSESEEEAEIMELLGNSGKIEDIVNTNPDPVTLKMKEGVIEDKEIKVVVPTTNKQGVPQTQAVVQYYEAVAADKKCTIKMVISSRVEGEEPVNVPLIYSSYGDEKFVQVEFPATDTGTITCQYKLLKDKSTGNLKSYLVVPALKAYFPMPADMEQDFYLGVIDAQEEKGEFVSAGEYKDGDKTYIVETYKNPDGSQTKYFMLNGELKRLQTDSDGETIIVEYTSRENWASSANFSIPSNFKDFSEFMDTDSDWQEMMTNTTNNN